MLALKYLLIVLGVGLFGSAGALVVYDVYISEQLRRLLARSKTTEAGKETGITAHLPFAPNCSSAAQKIAQTEVCAMASASQYPCGWLGTRCWKGGTIMSIKASTAALRRICQRLFPRQQCEPRHSASG
jgi:hypothetical protein